MGKRNIDISKEKFGRLIPVRKIGKDKKNQCIWLFQCECGKQTTSTPYIVRIGKKRSCGCLHSELLIKNNIKTKTKHGLSRSNFYRVFDGIKQRCQNTNSPDYKNWGKRGIKCLWNSFEEFKHDMYKSYLQHIKKFGKDTSIERINNDGHYHKENCKWATSKEQNNNRRTRIH